MTDLNIINNLSSALSVGFAATKITPEVPDSWIDINKDAVFQPGKGDTYTDGNGNGVFDPVWIAGFGNRRPANGIHDDLWARTMIIDDGKTRLAIVSIDVIGFMNNCVNDVRDLIPADDSITYLIISSTHTHGGPDLLGLWGKGPTKSGVNKVYLESVKVQIVKSVESAVSNLRPAYLTVSEDLTGAIPLVRDSRKPEVFDHGLRIIRAVDKQEGNTLGTLISWGNHPETFVYFSLEVPHLSIEKYTT